MLVLVCSYLMANEMGFFGKKLRYRRRTARRAMLLKILSAATRLCQKITFCYISRGMGV